MKYIKRFYDQPKTQSLSVWDTLDEDPRHLLRIVVKGYQVEIHHRAARHGEVAGGNDFSEQPRSHCAKS